MGLADFYEKHRKSAEETAGAYAETAGGEELGDEAEESARDVRETAEGAWSVAEEHSPAVANFMTGDVDEKTVDELEDAHADFREKIQNKEEFRIAAQVGGAVIGGVLGGPAGAQVGSELGAGWASGQDEFVETGTTMLVDTVLEELDTDELADEVLEDLPLREEIESFFQEAGPDMLDEIAEGDFSGAAGAAAGAAVQVGTEKILETAEKALDGLLDDPLKSWLHDAADKLADASVMVPDLIETLKDIGADVAAGDTRGAVAAALSFAPIAAMPPAGVAAVLRAYSEGASTEELLKVGARPLALKAIRWAEDKTGKVSEVFELYSALDALTEGDVGVSEVVDTVEALGALGGFDKELDDAKAWLADSADDAEAKAAEYNDALDKELAGELDRDTMVEAGLTDKEAAGVRDFLKIDDGDASSPDDDADDGATDTGSQGGSASPEPNQQAAGNFFGTSPDDDADDGGSVDDSFGSGTNGGTDGVTFGGSGSSDANDSRGGPDDSFEDNSPPDSITM